MKGFAHFRTRTGQYRDSITGRVPNAPGSFSAPIITHDRSLDKTILPGDWIQFTQFLDSQCNILICAAVLLKRTKQQICKHIVLICCDKPY